MSHQFEFCFKFSFGKQFTINAQKTLQTARRTGEVAQSVQEMTCEARGLGSATVRLVVYFTNGLGLDDRKLANNRPKKKEENAK